MHCYRTAADFKKPQTSGTDGALWFDYLGLQSSGHGKQGSEETIVAWTNAYGSAKTRVFSTTLGYNNDTVCDKR